MRSGVLKMRSCVLEKKKDAELCAEKCNATPECVGISIAVLLGHCWLKVAPFYYYCPRCPSCWATAGSRLPLFIIIVPVALFVGPLLAQGCPFLLLLSPSSSPRLPLFIIIVPVALFIIIIIPVEVALLVRFPSQGT